MDAGIEYVVHEIGVSGLKTRVEDFLGEAISCAFFEPNHGEDKSGFHLSRKGKRTGNLDICPEGKSEAPLTQRSAAEAAITIRLSVRGSFSFIGN